MASKVELGTASTNPRPNSGVVRRPATIVAGPLGTAGGCGTISPTKLTWVPTGPTADGTSVGKVPIPWEWMSEPPYWASGSNTPLVTVPYRVSVMMLPPPTALAS